jgi:hypothetical protein
VAKKVSQEATYWPGTDWVTEELTLDILQEKRSFFSTESKLAVRFTHLCLPAASRCNGSMKLTTIFYLRVLSSLQMCTGTPTLPHIPIISCRFIKHRDQSTNLKQWWCVEIISALHIQKYEYSANSVGKSTAGCICDPSDFFRKGFRNYRVVLGEDFVDFSSKIENGGLLRIISSNPRKLETR